MRCPGWNWVLTGDEEIALTTTALGDSDRTDSADRTLSFRRQDWKSDNERHLRQSKIATYLEVDVALPDLAADDASMSARTSSTQTSESITSDTRYPAS